MRLWTWCLLLMGIVALTGIVCSAPSRATDADRTPVAILESYVDDFRRDRAAAQARTFGVRVRGDGGGVWTIAVSGQKSAEGEWGVTLGSGAPTQPTFVYTVDVATLTAIDAGRLNALTAQGKAWSGDVSPMDVEWMEGAREFDVNPFSFHFWTRGFPEKVPFGPGLSRKVHGADNVAIYYQKGIRTIWSKLDRGERVSNGPGQPMLVPFPIIIFATAGRSQGTVGGQRVELKANEVMFIPPMTPYEWWNEHEERAEAILVMFGEGA